MKKEQKTLVWGLLQSLMISALVIFMVFPLSCRITEEGIVIVSGDYSAPELETVTVIDCRTVRLDFSEEVKLSGVVVSPYVESASDSEEVSSDETLSSALSAASGEYGCIENTMELSDDRKSVTLLLAEDTEIGKSYEIYGIVEDLMGNSLTFCVPFVGYNGRIPRVVMTEIQIKYGKCSENGNTIYRGEFVELLCLDDGNLAGIRIESSSDGDKGDFDLPAVEVRKGEIILVHLRYVDEGCVNEDGDDLTLATAPYANPTLRDIWSTDTSAHFHDSSDVIIIRDCVNSVILDGLMYAAPDATEWKEKVTEGAIELADAGIYSSSEITEASCSKSVSTKKSLTRNNASEILTLITDGTEFEYPFKAESSTWSVVSASAGEL